MVLELNAAKIDLGVNARGIDTGCDAFSESFSVTTTISAKAKNCFELQEDKIYDFHLLSAQVNRSQLLQKKLLHTNI